jgi:pimeloyl-ACP methyl ester carboxylesterase
MTDAPIWATTSGDPGGAHIVLVHGTLDRSAGLLKLARRLAERHLVTRYDRRGYGRSMPHGGPFAIADQVDDLMGVIERAPAGGPCVVFGHSYGGHVALAAAQREPARVSAVAVYESPLAWMPWWPSTTAGGDATSHASDPADAAERFMRRLFGDERWERLPPATRDARRAEGPALLGELNDIRAERPWTADSITAPVLAMRGERGQDHHRQGMALLGDWFGCEVITIDGANHFGPNTHPGKVAEALEAFVEASLRPTEDA